MSMSTTSPNPSFVSCSMACISSTIYAFEDGKLANWTTAQEKSVSTDYPFDLHAEPLDQYVARTYLQFLWLPESIMPLHLLVPSLQRVNVPSTSSDASVHPMHAFLQPLLLTTRTASAKYHTELPQILADGGGAGEMEETMMWYSLTHEKAPEDLSSDAEGPWSDEKWRERYFERMERREVQIQILLYFFKLSLPGPPPPEPAKKKRRSRKPEEPVLKAEDHLESFMDKLSMWQLAVQLDPSKPLAVKKDERDWVPKFAEDIVERQFKSTLPEACSLLRSKVFPSSPFSDSDSNAPTSRNPSPEPVRQARKSLSRAPSTSRLPSPTLSTSSRATTASSKAGTRALVRSRSRSLSVSLAQEQEERERANAAQPKKRVLNREISMSRVFKPKTKPKPEIKAKTKPEAPLPGKERSKEKDCGVTLVEETPAKSRAPPPVKSQGAIIFGKPSFDFSMKPLLLVDDGRKGGKAQLMSMQEDDGDEEWMMDSSPDILLLNPGLSQQRRRSVSAPQVDSDEEVEMVPATPSKPSKRKRK